MTTRRDSVKRAVSDYIVWLEDGELSLHEVMNVFEISSSAAVDHVLDCAMEMMERAGANCSFDVTDPDIREDARAALVEAGLIDDESGASMLVEVGLYDVNQTPDRDAARTTGPQDDKLLDEQDEAEAKKRLKSIEKKYGRTWKSKLKAFDWADDPEAALADLMRKAGRDPKSEATEVDDMPLSELRDIVRDALESDVVVESDERPVSKDYVYEWMLDVAGDYVDDDGELETDALATDANLKFADRIPLETYEAEGVDPSDLDKLDEFFYQIAAGIENSYY